MTGKRYLILSTLLLSFTGISNALIALEAEATELYTSRSHTGVLTLSDVRINRSSKLYDGPSPTHFKRFNPGRYSYKDFSSLIRHTARSNGLSSSLIRAIIEVESAYDPKAVSKAGAIGLMQIMPQTARSLGVNPWKASENIEGGTRYLKKLMKRYNNNLRLSLAAYNAGVGNVERYGGIPPFQETKAYVKKVLKRYTKYSKRDRVTYKTVSFVPPKRKKRDIEINLSSYPTLSSDRNEEIKRGNIATKKTGNTLQLINLYD